MKTYRHFSITVLASVLFLALAGATISWQAEFEPGKERWVIKTSVPEGQVPLAKLLIEKGLITEAEFIRKLSAERGSYHTLLQKMR